MNIQTLLITSLFFVGMAARAETSAPALTMEAALAEAMDRSPDLARARALEAGAGWRRFEAMGRSFLPKVSLNAQHMLSEKYSVTEFHLGPTALNMPGLYPINQAALEVTVPIFDGMTNVREYQAADLESEAASAERAHAAFQLKEHIRLAFTRALAAAQLKAVAEQNVKTLEDHLKQVEVQNKGGVARNYDVLRVQVQLNEARADAIDAVDNVETSRKKLTQLLGLEDDARELSGILPVPTADKVNALKFEGVPTEREDLRAMNLHSDAANRKRQGAATWLVPSIALMGSYGFYESQIYNNGVTNTNEYRNVYQIGVSLRWNLFDGGVAMAKAREAAYSQIAAAKAAQAAKLQVPYDFEYWKRRYLSNTDHYTSKAFDIKRSEESVRLAKDEEVAGTRTSTETLDAELDLFRAKAGVVNAQLNSAEAQIQLELALGREI